MRVIRAAVLAIVLTGAAAAAAGPAMAQTTTVPPTTVPAVPSIPVTPGPVRPAGSGEVASSDLAVTGIGADRLVPLGMVMVAVGAVLEATARRRLLLA